VSPPVRLKVTYKTPESLLGELTKSVGRGGVRIESKKALPIGTEFVFELRSPGVREPVEVLGRVMSVSEVTPGKHALLIKYEAPKQRGGLEAVIRRIFETAQFDKKRSSPRIPMHVRATETRPSSPTYRLRDISQGGVGVDVEGDVLPAHLKVGAAFLMQLKLSTGQLSLPGEIVWAVSTRSGTVPPCVGVRFRQLDTKSADLLDDLLKLRALPTPPWIARVWFGPEALAAAR
jgi:Tfp pilus assembly protein PilZ